MTRDKPTLTTNERLSALEDNLQELRLEVEQSESEVVEKLSSIEDLLKDIRENVRTTRAPPRPIRRLEDLQDIRVKKHALKSDMDRRARLMGLAFVKKEVDDFLLKSSFPPAGYTGNYCDFPPLPGWLQEPPGVEAGTSDVFGETAKGKTPETIDFNDETLPLEDETTKLKLEDFQSRVLKWKAMKAEYDRRALDNEAAAPAPDCTPMRGPDLGLKVLGKKAAAPTPNFPPMQGPDPGYKVLGKTDSAVAMPDASMAKNIPISGPAKKKPVPLEEWVPDKTALEKPPVVKRRVRLE